MPKIASPTHQAETCNASAASLPRRVLRPNAPTLSPPAINGLGITPMAQKYHTAEEGQRTLPLLRLRDQTLGLPIQLATPAST